VAYRFVDHTAEVEVELEGDSAEEVLAAAVGAVRELVAPDARPAGERIEVTVDVAAADRPALLAAWLEELVFLAETRGLVPLAARDLRLHDDRVRARVQGVAGAPRPYVKAVTYHRLELACVDGRWRGRVVLDV
jgi:SHS2 domain-containing protein